jgi:hypothetical protein
LDQPPPLSLRSAFPFVPLNGKTPPPAPEKIRDWRAMQMAGQA